MKLCFGLAPVCMVAVGCTLVVDGGDLGVVCTPRPLLDGGALEDFSKGDPCAPLNQDRDLDNDCMLWQCRPDQRGCELRARDLDGDGFASARACSEEEVGEDRDCDDGRKGVRPGAEEVCDGLDNDCDGDVDEGLPWGVTQQAAAASSVDASLRASVLPDPERLLVVASVGEPGLRGVQAAYLDGVSSEPSFADVVRAGEPSCEVPWSGEQCVGAPPTCSFRALSVVASGSSLFTAGIDTGGDCGAGRVLFGRLADAAMPQASASGDAWTGLNGERSDECGSPCAGARQLTLTAGVREGALALWWQPVDDQDGQAGGTHTLHAATLRPGNGRSRVLLHGRTRVSDSRHGPSSHLLEMAAPVPPQAVLAVERTGSCGEFLIAYPAEQSDCAGTVLWCERRHADALRFDICGCVEAPEGESVRRVAVARLGAGRIGLAQRSESGIFLQTITLDGAGERCQVRSLDTFSLSSTRVVDGPLLVGVDAESSGAAGRWLPLWLERCSKGRCLRGALLSEELQRELVAPHTLQLMSSDAALLSPFTLASRQSHGVLSSADDEVHTALLACEVSGR